METMTVYDKAHFVSLATAGGKCLSPLHDLLVGMLVSGDLMPPSDWAVREMDLLYADVVADRYRWAAGQLGNDPALPTAEDVVTDWGNSVMERKAGQFCDMERLSNLFLDEDCV